MNHKRRRHSHKMHQKLTGFFYPGIPFRTAYERAWIRGVQRRDKAKEKTHA